MLLLIGRTYQPIGLCGAFGNVCFTKLSCSGQLLPPQHIRRWHLPISNLLTQLNNTIHRRVSIFDLPLSFLNNLICKTNHGANLISRGVTDLLDSFVSLIPTSFKAISFKMIDFKLVWIYHHSDEF